MYISLDGQAVAFCLLRSQSIGAIVLQLSPLGQHMADRPSLNVSHVFEDGQQKLLGRPGLLHAV